MPCYGERVLSWGRSGVFLGVVLLALGACGGRSQLFDGFASGASPAHGGGGTSAGLPAHAGSSGDGFGAAGSSGTSDGGAAQGGTAGGGGVAGSTPSPGAAGAAAEGGEGGSGPREPVAPTMLAMGNEHTCVLAGEGSVWGWGTQGRGE